VTSDPAENPAASVAASARNVAVDPVARFTGGTPLLPEPLAALPAAGTRRFMCCDPAASAMESLLHALKRKETVASTVSRT
jgi:hypothetical protein